MTDTATTLLTEVADALNKLGELGEKVTINYGAIITDHGYVMPWECNTWVARMKVNDPVYRPVLHPGDEPGDD